MPATAVRRPARAGCRGCSSPPEGGPEAWGGERTSKGSAPLRASSSPSAEAHLLRSDRRMFAEVLL